MTILKIFNQHSDIITKSIANNIKHNKYSAMHYNDFIKFYNTVVSSYSRILYAFGGEMPSTADLTVSVNGYITDTLFKTYGSVNINIDTELFDILKNVDVESIKQIDLLKLIKLPFVSFKLQLPYAIKMPMDETDTDSDIGEFLDAKEICVNILDADLTDGVDETLLTPSKAIIIQYSNIKSHNIARTAMISFNADGNYNKFTEYNIVEHAMLVNILLYMSTYNNDLTYTKIHKDYDTNTKPCRFINKKMITTKIKPLTLGYRLGTKIATIKSLQQSNTSQHLNQGDGNVVRTTTPHVRRAHWAKYYVGKRKDCNGDRIPTEKQSFIMKLKAPAFINFDIGEEITPVMRDLK